MTTLSLSHTAIIKQYLPSLYFIAVVVWMTVETDNMWISLIALPFIIQMILNNKYLNLTLGSVMILWSVYMAWATFFKIDNTVLFISVALCFTVFNFYMSRMMFLNQSFSMSALRENSLDETMFI